MRDVRAAPRSALRRNALEADLTARTSGVRSAADGALMTSERVLQKSTIGTGAIDCVRRLQLLALAVAALTDWNTWRTDARGTQTRTLQRTSTMTPPGPPWFVASIAITWVP